MVENKRTRTLERDPFSDPDASSTRLPCHSFYFHFIPSFSGRVAGVERKISITFEEGE